MAGDGRTGCTVHGLIIVDPRPQARHNLLLPAPGGSHLRISSRPWCVKFCIGYAAVGSAKRSVLARTPRRSASWIIPPAASAARPIATNIGSRALIDLLQRARDERPEDGADPPDAQFHADRRCPHVGLIGRRREIVQDELRADDEEAGGCDAGDVHEMVVHEHQRQNRASAEPPPQAKQAAAMAKPVDKVAKHDARRRTT